MRYVLFAGAALGVVLMAGTMLSADEPTVKPTEAPADLTLEQALLAVLDVERQSKATYAAVLEKHRPIHPFGMVYRQERQHEQAVVDELTRRGIAVPANSWSQSDISVAETPQQARSDAADLEAATVAAYDRVIKLSEDEELCRTMQQLRDESVHHQWMFTADRARQRGPGNRPGRGGGHGARDGTGAGAGGSGACCFRDR